MHFFFFDVKIYSVLFRGYEECVKKLGYFLATLLELKMIWQLCLPVKSSVPLRSHPVSPVGRFSRPIGLVLIRSCGKILEFAGCGFLGYFLFKAAGFWAGFWVV